MKKILFSLILLSISLPVLSQQMDKVDTVIFECIEKHYTQHKIDLKEALDSIEYELIKQKAIVSADSTGIKTYYRSIANGADVPRINYTPLMDSIASNYHFHGNLRACILDNPAVDSFIFENSNYMQNQVELVKKANELGGVNPINAAKAMLAVHSGEDFSTDLFRVHFLLSILATADTRRSYLKSDK
ncbi:MAG: hypothetical protein WEA99_15260 [Brumimicrobium sp.]